MNNEQAMQILADMGLHEGGMDNWVPNNAWYRFAALVEAAARADEREACLKIISEYQIPVGSSSAGEIACEMTYGALKDIRDDITARGTT
jgi:hypothetical protein